MVGVLGLEDSDLGLEIIKLLSGGNSGVDDIDRFSRASGSCLCMIQHRFCSTAAYTGNIKQPFSIGVRT